MLLLTTASCCVLVSVALCVCMCASIDAFTLFLFLKILLSCVLFVLRSLSFPSLNGLHTSHIEHSSPHEALDMCPTK